MRKLLAVGLGVGLMLCACRSAPEVVPSGCSINGEVLDATGLEHGIYGVREGRFEPAPLARLDHTILQSEGVDPESGKKWLRLQLDEAGAEQLKAFTSEPAGRSIAVVANGLVVSQHKVREALVSREVQVSCCDSRACERLHGLFAPGGVPGALMPQR